MTVIVKDLVEVVEEGASRYAKYVSLNRQFPDERDGLLPVQRMIIWSLAILGSKDHIKCARIVGDTTGKYHPHGDASVYGTLCNMTPYHMPMPIIVGDGNFGTLIDGAASPRYTDASLSIYGRMFIDPDYISLVPYVNNYDGKEQIPVYLPSLLPNLLLNGCFGIGYGYMISIPSFTLDSVEELITKAMDRVITNKTCRILEPFFIYGAVLDESCSLTNFYETGSGSLKAVPQISVEGKVIYVTGVYEINYEVFAATLNEMPEVKTISDSLDATTTTPMRILVQCNSNVAEVKAKIVSLLTVTKPLACNTITNDIPEDFEHDNETLPSTLRSLSLGDYVNNWVDYRIQLESAMYKRKVQLCNTEIERMSALVAAGGKLPELARVLSEKELSDAEMKIKTQKLLNVTPEQAAIVLEATLKRLSRLNIHKVQDDLAAKQKEKKDYLNKLRNIETVTLARVKSDFAILRTFMQSLTTKGRKSKKV